ncbi:hypothetical protein ACOTJF_29980, partial [Achromobacter ruhlandii]|uniref:hypothetical protein n=1 Tax=Achromobacter ruhlandii TaxID=72557 RepID=UPI003BA33D30
GTAFGEPGVDCLGFLIRSFQPAGAFSRLSHFLKEAVSTKDSDYTQFLGLVRVCPCGPQKKSPQRCAAEFVAKVRERSARRAHGMRR